MAMAAGSVVIASDGGVTKSGMAEAIYDSFVNNYTADVRAATGKDGVAIPGGSTGVAIKRGYAIQATRMAAIVGYITANATAEITMTTIALQTTPNPNNPDTDTKGPGADKHLAIV